MFFNYLTVAIRNLLRSRVYAFINVVGLGIGLACTLLLALFVHHEWSFDRYHAEGDRVYRVLRRDQKASGRITRYGLVHRDLGPLLAQSMDEFLHVSRLIHSDTPVSAGARTTEMEFVSADPSLFQIFTIPFVAGDPGTAFQDIKNAVIALLLGEVSRLRPGA